MRNSTLIAIAVFIVGIMFLTTGCQTFSQAQQRAAAADVEIAAKVCKLWKPQTYSKNDTAETKAEVRAKNAQRAAFCSG